MITITTTDFDGKVSVYRTNSYQVSDDSITFISGNYKKGEPLSIEVINVRKCSEIEILDEDFTWNMKGAIDYGKS